MNLSKRAVFILILFLLVINFALAQPMPTSFKIPSSVPTPTDATSAFNKALSPIQSHISEENGIVPSIDPSTTIDNAISPVTGIQGSNILKAKGFLLEGTGIKSIVNSNFIPFYNLVDGSIVAFDLNKDQLVSVQQFLNKNFLDEFRTTLSKGSKFRQFFRNSDTVITFEATDDSSVFIRKDKTYRFERGILAFRNNDITEKITTVGVTEAEIDMDKGITSLVLAKNSSYSYESQSNPEVNFLLVNNANKYVLMIRKSSETINKGSFIDLITNRMELDGLITLKKKVKGAFKVFYESLNEKNRIKIDLSDSGAVITNIFLEVKGTSNIANIYTGYYKIAEKNVNVHKRLAAFVEESPVILRYASSLDNNRIITLDPKSKLTQEKQNKVILIAKESIAYQKCSESLKTFMQYKDESFIEEC